jgi:FMN phosphatase YigB (HAD superfamily)
LRAGIWANTRVATSAHLRQWLARAGLDHRISFITTSVDLGFRKPALEFFNRALAACGLNSEEVLFVGNQLDSDIAGANGSGIACVYLADVRYRSVDERQVEARPTYTIETLFELPRLIQDVQRQAGFFHPSRS